MFQCDNAETVDEEVRWGERTEQMKLVLTRHYRHSNHTTFKRLVHRNNRKQVAVKFYAILVLRKQQQVNLEQSEPFADITIWRGSYFRDVG